MTDSKYDNSAAAWRNDNRETDSHPHFKGSAMIEGREYWFSVWINMTPDGNSPPIKAKFQRKEPRAPVVPAGQEMEALAGIMGKDTGSPPTYVPGEDKPFDDDLPF